MIDEQRRAKLLAGLSPEERRQIVAYVKIFTSNGFKEHWQVNEWIGDHDLWDEFPNIRAINDHERAEGVLGISPKFFAIVCRLLELDDFEGSRLIKSRRY